MELYHCTLLIVDDHPLMRRGVRQLLEQEPRLQVIAEASNGMEALTIARQLLPDVILLDLNMKGMSGLETLKALRQQGSAARVLIFTVSAASHDICTLVDAGADGYLLKESEPEPLLRQIMQGAAGEKVFSPPVQQVLATRQQRSDPFAQLTAREREVLQLVARGQSNKAIACTLRISEETVKVHIRHLLRKLKVHSRVAATVLWLESGYH